VINCGELNFSEFDEQLAGEAGPVEVAGDEGWKVGSTRESAFGRFADSGATAFACCGLADAAKALRSSCNAAPSLAEARSSVRRAKAAGVSGTISATGSSAQPERCDGLLNADQPVGHLRFSWQIQSPQLLPRSTDLVPEARFWELAGQF
jgi:hypothetical protein